MSTKYVIPIATDVLSRHFRRRCCLDDEEASDRASAVLERCTAEQVLLISDWSLTEVASAIALKVRTRQLEHRSRIIQAFDFLIADTFEVLPVERGHFRNATAFIGRPAVNLRSGGALHPAIATHRHYGPYP